MWGKGDLRNNAVGRAAASLVHVDGLLSLDGLGGVSVGRVGGGIHLRSE
jgi:hypothetical protein